MADSQIAVFSATGGVQFRLGDDVNWRWWAGGVFQSRSPGLVEGKTAPSDPLRGKWRKADFGKPSRISFQNQPDLQNSTQSECVKVLIFQGSEAIWQPPQGKGPRYRYAKI